MRAPLTAFFANSASAPTSAIVLGLGFCAIASSKKPRDQSVTGSGPAGRIWKYWLYLNLSFTARPNRAMKVRLRCIMIGIAGAIRLVP